MSKTRRNLTHTNGNGNGHRLEDYFKTSSNGKPKQQKSVEDALDLTLKSQPIARTPNQKKYLGAIAKSKLTIVTGPAGSGKAQPLDSILYTPDGPIKMGDVKVGDEICSENGDTTIVTGVFPQGERDIYAITFRDGSIVEASDDHWWVVYDMTNLNYKKITTKDLSLNHRRNRGESRYCIRSCGEVFFNYQEVPIEPYMMGILLGDGSFRKGIKISNIDSEILNSISCCLNEKYTLSTKSNVCDYRIVRKSNHTNGGSFEKNIYIDKIKELGLYNLKSEDKFIPEIYLYNTVDIRIALLQGMMDADGTVSSKSGTSPYLSTSSEKMAIDFKNLVMSLGGTCRITSSKKFFTHKGQKKLGKTAYRCYINMPDNNMVFRLTRKKNLISKKTKKYLPNRKIDKVEFVGRKECQCISIDHPSHLYLTDNFVLTHNTHLAMGMASKYLSDGDVDRIIVVRPFISCDEEIGFLPGDLNAKADPFMRPLFDELAEFFTDEQINKLVSGRRPIVEIVPLAVMKGRTFKRAFIILDEAQDATYKQIKMLLTRMGEASKIVITGDITQTDRVYDDGCPLEKIIERLHDAQGVGFSQLTPEDNQRDPFVELILERI